jgi:hypothetical protein
MNDHATLVLVTWQQNPGTPIDPSGGSHMHLPATIGEPESQAACHAARRRFIGREEAIEDNKSRHVGATPVFNDGILKRVSVTSTICTK